MNKSTIFNKPPLGIKPKNIWILERKKELISAMGRYTNSNMNIPIEWIEKLKWLEDNSGMSLADAMGKEYIYRPIK